MAINVTEVVRRAEDRKKKKSPWLPHWQVLGEYFLTRKSDFTVQRTQGDFLNRDLFDATGSKCLRTWSAAMIGSLWPDGGDSFRLKRPDNIPETTEVKKYYDKVHSILARALNDPRAGLETTLGEYMTDQGGIGTSAVAVFEGDGDVDLLFRPWDVKRMSIGEGKNGYVCYIYFEDELTVEVLIGNYGLEKVSQKVQELYKNNKRDEIVKVLIAIEPRIDRDVTKKGVLDMPVMTAHIELDTKHLLKESGFDDMSVFVGRAFKMIGEDYGRCPAMDALPDALEANAIREAVIVATEKALDPPLGVLDDGSLGGTSIDTSASAINVFRVSPGRIGTQQPIFPLYTQGDMKWTKDRIEELKQSISDHFMIDKLLDLNNETEMTLGEAQLRNKLRGMMLGSLFARQTAEVFTPMIERSFNIMLKKGRLGVMANSNEAKAAALFGEEVLIIPEAVAKAMLAGQDVYEIEYLTPAARMVQAEVTEGIINTWKFTNDVLATQPDAIDNLDPDLSLQLIAPLLGAPRAILRDKETIEKIRKVRAAAQAAAQKKQDAMDAAKMAADVSKLAPQPGAQGVDAPAMTGALASV